MILILDKKFKDALDLYTKALELNPNIPAYWCNRSFSYLKLELYGYAINDAEQALKIDPQFIKAYYRRASAYMALSELEDALADLRLVVKYAPSDKDARIKLAEVEKTIRRLDFEKAMSYEDNKSLESAIDFSSITVEPSYEGMKWEDDQLISLDFINDMIQKFEKQKKLHRKYALRIMLSVKKLFSELPSLVDIKIPGGQKSFLTICGDVHGQFYDLLNIFRTNGFPSETHSYLFNGDFVDRGSFSCEVILLLLSFKLLYPNNFFMSRGNHETIDMNRVYGFEGEIKHKYNEMTFKLFTDIFNSIPLCNVIENRIFVVHGGLFSRDDVTLDEIRRIDRFRQPPPDSLMCEMLWSDPMIAEGRRPSKRGVGIEFGPDVTRNFLRLNNLDLIIRSHEVKDEGYVIDHDGCCVTVFSAPNYCDQIGNKGAYINVYRKGSECDIRPELSYEYKSFKEVWHPDVKPMQFAGMFGGMFGL